MEKAYTVSEINQALSNLVKQSTEVESINEAIEKAHCVAIRISYLGENMEFLKDGNSYFFHPAASAEAQQDNFRQLEQEIYQILNKS